MIQQNSVQIVDDYFEAKLVETTVFHIATKSKQQF
jgi:hypothetical protein